MWTVEKIFRFEASHQLPHHQGKCNRLHGHSWVGKCLCEGKSLEEAGSSKGMVINFNDITKAIEPLLENYLDHWHLNDTLKLDNPTAEEVARWIYEQVKPKLPALKAIIIEETCSSRCEYRP